MFVYEENQILMAELIQSANSVISGFYSIYVAHVIIFLDFL